MPLLKQLEIFQNRSINRSSPASWEKHRWNPESIYLRISEFQITHFQNELPWRQPGPQQHLGDCVWAIDHVKGLLAAGRDDAVEKFLEEVGDTELTGLATHRVIASGIACIPEGRKVFPKLTVEENVRIVLEPLGLTTNEINNRIDELLADLMLIADSLREHGGQRAAAGAVRAAALSSRIPS